MERNASFLFPKERDLERDLEEEEGTNSWNATGEELKGEKGGKNSKPFSSSLFFSPPFLFLDLESFFRLAFSFSLALSLCDQSRSSF
jgi:hypothetical protein